MTKMFLLAVATVVLSLSTSYTDAFSAATNPSRPIRPDASAAVEEALKVTAAYGIESKEARVAWDIVEEMDASDNSEALKGSLVEECDPDDMTPACLDYGRFLEELRTIQNVMAEQAQDRKKRNLVEVLKNVKLSAAEGTKVTSSPQLTDALEKAKAATAQHGITSSDARLAWETYEEIASSDRRDNAMGVSLLEECSVESGQEACQAIAELDRVMGVLMALQA